MKYSIVRSPISSPIVGAIVSPINTLPIKPSAAFSPLDIASCRLCLDASDMTTMFTDTAGTTAVTASTESY